MEKKDIKKARIMIRIVLIEIIFNSTTRQNGPITELMMDGGDTIPFQS